MLNDPSQDVAHVVQGVRKVCRTGCLILVESRQTFLYEFDAGVPSSRLGLGLCMTWLSPTSYMRPHLRFCAPLLQLDGVGSGGG